MKRIAIFCDGTWNTPNEKEDGQYCRTNVVKMYNVLSPVSDDGLQQIGYYDAGVGTEGGKLRRLFDGATGSGIVKNILQAYEFLVENYEPGDELFFFGFSRGAFTVRCLSGMIRNSGILKFEYKDKINRAYKIYHSKRAIFHPDGKEAILFRKTFATEEDTRIKFIGVWDTVGALGNPLYLRKVSPRTLSFHDRKLSSRVGYAYQALAIDEKRMNFKPTFWYQNAGVKNQVLEQVWFAGVHTDVGGGNKTSESGLSDISLQWILDKAVSCQLKFDPIELHPNLESKIHESYTGFYKIIRPYARPIDVPDPKEGQMYQSLYSSVQTRYRKNDSYRPKNLVNYFHRHPE